MQLMDQYHTAMCFQHLRESSGTKECKSNTPIQVSVALTDIKSSNSRIHEVDKHKFTMLWY